MIRPAPIAHRLFAALCTALVLALGVFASDDRLHARLHAPNLPDCGHAHADPVAPAGEAHDESCAVELFAAGLSLPVDPSNVLVEPLRAAVATRACFLEVSVAPSPHRLPPALGPPRA